MKLAGIQTDIALGDAATNLATMQRHLQDLAEPDLFLAVFPECFLTGYCYESLEEARGGAVQPDSPEIRQIQQFASTFDTHIVFGFLESAGDQVYNSCALATRQGQLHIYRKVHLPRLGVDRFTTPGDSFRPVVVDGVSIGLNICYDCSFPEPARLLALQEADLVVLPTNWPPGASHTADCIPNARALENHVFYMAINRIGQERGFRFIGKSKICHPEGFDLAFADHDGPAVLVADFDPRVARNKHLVRVPGQHEIHRFADRRPEFYQPIASKLKTERK